MFPHSESHLPGRYKNPVLGSFMTFFTRYRLLGSEALTNTAQTIEHLRERFPTIPFLRVIPVHAESIVRDIGNYHSAAFW